MSSSESLKIAIFISALKTGGAERVASNLANYWSNEGHSISLVNLEKPSADDYVLVEEISRISLNLSRPNNNPLISIYMSIKRIAALRRVLKRVKPDVLLAFMTSSNVIAIIAAYGLPINVVVSERQHPPRTDAAKYWVFLRRWLYGFADVVVVLAEESKKWVLTNTRSKNVCVLPNALKWPLPKTKGSVDPYEHIENDRKVLLAVGRLAHQKGYSFLLEAFAKLANEHSEWSLYIVGAGDQKDLKRDIAELQLDDRIFLIGAVGNVADWYKRADLYVMSSRHEGFPNSLAEAMAAGCAPVSFDCDTGPRDIIEPGVTGILVEPENADALALALSDLMSDTPRRIAIGKAACVVRETYAQERIMARWSQLIKNI